MPFQASRWPPVFAQGQAVFDQRRHAGNATGQRYIEVAAVAVCPAQFLSPNRKDFYVGQLKMLNQLVQKLCLFTDRLGKRQTQSGEHDLQRHTREAGAGADINHPRALRPVGKGQDCRQRVQKVANLYLGWVGNGSEIGARVAVSQQPCICGKLAQLRISQMQPQALSLFVHYLHAQLLMEASSVQKSGKHFPPGKLRPFAQLFFDAQQLVVLGKALGAGN